MGILIFIIVSWFIFGFVSMLMLATHDLRGKEYNEDYANVKDAIIVICFGYVSFVVACCVLIFEIVKERLIYEKANRYLMKFVYKIANIGLKEDEG